MRLFLLVVTTVMLTAAACAQSNPTLRSESSALKSVPTGSENGRVKYIYHVQIPAEVEGKLISLDIEEGDIVAMDSVIGVIDDRAAKMAVALKQAEELEAEINATNEVNLKDAVNNEELARAEAAAYKELREQRAVPYWEMEKKRLEAERAKLRIELAEMQMRTEKAKYFAKREERKIAEFEVQRRQILAPFDGYIETRTAQPGEWVQPGSPIAMLVKIDKLRVEADVKTLVAAGTPAQVVITVDEDSARTTMIEGKIGFVSSEVDLNGRYRVWVEIDNQKLGDSWLIKPGMEARILIQP